MNFTSYKKRPIRFLGIYKYKNWKLKVYGISAKNEYPPDPLIEAAKSQLPDWLTLAKAYDWPVYDIGFVIIHGANDGNYVLVNWWLGENMLQHYIYFSTREKPDTFKLVSDKGLMGCVWELEVINFERIAWVEHILKKAANPDFERYLNEHSNTDF